MKMNPRELARLEAARAAFLATQPKVHPPCEAIGEKHFSECSVDTLRAEIARMQRIGETMKLTKDQKQRIRALNAEIRSRGDEQRRA